MLWKLLIQPWLEGTQVGSKYSAQVSKGEGVCGLKKIYQPEVCEITVVTRGWKCTLWLGITCTVIFEKSDVATSR